MNPGDRALAALLCLVAAVVPTGIASVDERRAYWRRQKGYERDGCVVIYWSHRFRHTPDWELGGGVRRR